MQSKSFIDFDKILKKHNIKLESEDAVFIDVESKKKMPYDKSKHKSEKISYLVKNNKD